jgi:peptidyl-prolyl cis-trans isomerase B (cyclophilin B)
VHQVSPNDRERERAKRRYEKQQAARQRHEAEARRNRQVVAIVLAVLLVVGGLVGISLAMRGTHATPTAAATPRATGATAPLVRGCSTPPAVPGARTATLPPKATAAGKTFVATVTTSCGDITMELDGARAPQTVASFLGLAATGTTRPATAS